MLAAGPRFNCDGMTEDALPRGYGSRAMSACRADEEVAVVLSGEWAVSTSQTGLGQTCRFSQ